MPRPVFTVGGTVQAGGGRYLTRSVDQEFLDACRNGDFAYVLTARQMGKSSLMVRTAEQLALEGAHSVVIDLSQVGVRVTPDEWYLGILSELEDALDLDTDAYTWWGEHAHLSLTQRLTQFFREVALREVEGNIVVFFDEIDSTLSLEFTDDFFAAIRYVYNARSKTPDFNRLSFVLIGVATPSDLISDPTRTPFNVGRRVDVGYFTIEEALPLADGFGQCSERGETVLRWVLDWTSGHPYLTQRLAHAVSKKDCSQLTKDDVDRTVAETFFGDRSEQDSNLRFVHDMLTVRAPDPIEVLSMYKSVLAGKRVDDAKQSRTVTHLKLSGIVRGEGGLLAVQNAVYGHVFDLDWLNRQWPEHWIRRVPPAVIGLVAASFVAIVLFGVLVFESQRRSQAQDYSQELADVNEQLVVQQDSVISLNSELSDQLTRADSLRQQAEAARGELAQQFAITDASRREAEVLNEQLIRSISVGDSLLVEVQQANESLGKERDQSDSLAQLALNRLDEARLARRETVTLALATKAVRLLSVGDPELAALLARQAYAFSDTDGEFRDPIYDALRQSLNVVGRDRGGPAVVARHDGGVRDVTYSPDGTWLATAGEDGRIGLARIDGIFRQQVRYVDAHNGLVRALAFSPDGSVLYSAGNDGFLRKWQVPFGPESRPEEVARHNAAIWALAVSSDGNRIASGGSEGAAILTSKMGERYAEVARLTVDSAIRSLAFIDGRDALVVGREDGRVTVWPVRGTSADAVTVDTGHGRVLSVAVHPAEDLVATVGDDRLVRLWPVTAEGSFGAPFMLAGHEGAINDVSFNRSGSDMLTASADRSVRLWRNYLEVGTTPIILQQHDDWVWAAAFAPNGSYLASAAEDRSTLIWRTRMNDMAEDICEVVTDRVLTQEEWSQHVGGDFDIDSDYARCTASGVSPAVTSGSVLRGTDNQESNSHD